MDDIKPKVTRKRRRLKRPVKRILVLICFALVLLVFRPWNLALRSCSSVKADTIGKPSDTLIGLNHLISNDDSQIPEAARFDRAVNQFMKKWEIEGASVAIMKDGNLIYSKGYGYADREDSVHTDVRHIFRIASVSKLITAVGIMKLYEAGRLKMDSRVFGPNGILNDLEFTNYTDKRINDITIEQLLRHKGGYSVRAGDPMFAPMDVARAMNVTSPPADENTTIRYGLQRGLGFRPGGRTAYSNMGYLVLSKVIEKLSGTTYERYIQDSILTPIGCYDMHIARNLHRDKYPNEVRYYESSDAELVEACDGSGRMVPKCDGGNNVTVLSGAGAWVASPVELLKFVAAIDGESSKPDILKASTIRLMTDETRNALPIGWMRTRGDGEWWRTGSMAGTSAMLRKQSNGYTWMFVTNTSSWKGSRFPNLISGMLKQAFGRVTEWPERDMFQTDSMDVIY